MEGKEGSSAGRQDNLFVNKTGQWSAWLFTFLKPILLTTVHCTVYRIPLSDTGSKKKLSVAQLCVKPLYLNITILWRMKSANGGEGNSATLALAYIYLFPDFMCQSYTIAQRIKSLVRNTRILFRVSLQYIY
jgi:hypothetical protein